MKLEVTKQYFAALGGARGATPPGVGRQQMKRAAKRQQQARKQNSKTGLCVGVRVSNLYLQTLTDAWCTSHRMHEIPRLPCVLGCVDAQDTLLVTANLRTIIMAFRGFDSSIILILRSGILMSKGDFPESLDQAIVVGIMLGRLGVP